MIKNGIRALKADGKPIVNGWLSMGSPFAAEVMAEQGFDSLTADMQHGVLDYRDTVAMFQAIRASGVVPIARVPWLEPGIIMKTLDAGALAVICPMINTREQAERLVSYVRYPPGGVRSFGPTRANIALGSNYAAEANREVVCLAMVETAESFANLDEIVATPGLDGIYIGPADLTLGLSNGALPPGFDSREPQIVDAIKRIQAAASGAGLLSCLHCGDPAYAAEAVTSWGFDLVTISTDARLLASGASQGVARAKALCAGQPDPAARQETGSY